MNLTNTTLILALSLPSMAIAQSALEQHDVHVSITAGVASIPRFLGDDEQQITAVPDITISFGDRFTASLDGASYTVFEGTGLRLGVVGTYATGRSEDVEDDNPFLIKGRNTSDLEGLGDIDGTIELGGFVAYEFQQLTARAEVRRGVDGGHDGIVGEASVTYNGAINDSAFFSIGPAIAFGNDEYNSTFFDVSAAQSLASGLNEYDAGGGLISVGVHASAVMPLSDTTSLIGFANFDQLADDISKSSIVKERGAQDQVSAGMLINYAF